MQTQSNAAVPLRVGIAGLGQGAAGMMPAMRAMPEIEIVAGADRNAVMRDGFSERFPTARTYDSVATMCDDPRIDVVYVGTPNCFHAEHAIEAMRRGKHVIVEKPMAITLDEANRMIETAASNQVLLAAAHTRSQSIWYRAMRKLALSGEIGPVRAIHISAYTDWLLRPRTADELDPAQGGGVVYRQGPHQIDTVRLLGGGLVRSVRSTVGMWMPGRNIPGYYCAFLEFDDRTVATVMHDGNGYHSTSEAYPWVKKRRDFGPSKRREIRAALRDGTRDEENEKQAFRIGGSSDPTADGRVRGGPQDWSPFDLGPVDLICERGIVRNARTGLLVYDDNGSREIDLTHLWRPEPDPSGGLSIAILEEMYEAVVRGRPLYHDGTWGRATLEVALAINTSALERREVFLEYQVPMPVDYDAGLQLYANSDSGRPGTST